MPGSDEFESISKVIADQFDDNKRKEMLKKQQESADAADKAYKKILEEKLGKELKELDDKLSNLRVKSFLLPKGTEILVPTKEFYYTSSKFERRQFEVVITNKDVTYDTEEVCFSLFSDVPVKCDILNSQTPQPSWVNDYIGFILPRNDKGAKFFLVRRSDLKSFFTIEEDKIPDQKIMDFLNKVIKQDPFNLLKKK